MSADDKTRIIPAMLSADVGTQLSGIYELDQRLASGGMGEVFRGHNIQTGDHVAIKIVLPEFARDQTILQLFRKEASILNHLSHDAVVRYHVFTIDPTIGRPYLAMEFVDGESLFDVMRRGPMAVADVRRLCHRLTSGLSAVHAAGAIHRDLSPDNIILPGGRVDRAKIIDFGIARSANVGGETLIGGKFAGKYNYVSPEQLGLYGGDVTERSDIYSLGLVLAAALRAKPLEMSGSQFEIIEKRRAVPDLSDIDEEFRPILDAMLQPDPQDRPASMADIARYTRDLVAEAESAASAGSLDRLTAPPKTAQPWSDDPGSTNRPTSTAGFVPHRPAARPASTVASQAPSKAAQPEMPRSKRGAALAVAAVVFLSAGGTGAYLGGMFDPWMQVASPVEPTPVLSEAEAPVQPVVDALSPETADASAPVPELITPAAETPVDKPATEAAVTQEPAAPESVAQSEPAGTPTSPAEAVQEQLSVAQAPETAPAKPAAQLPIDKPQLPIDEPNVPIDLPEARQDEPQPPADPPASADIVAKPTPEPAIEAPTPVVQAPAPVIPEPVTLVPAPVAEPAKTPAPVEEGAANSPPPFEPEPEAAKAAPVDVARVGPVDPPVEPKPIAEPAAPVSPPVAELPPTSSDAPAKARPPIQDKPSPPPVQAETETPPVAQAETANEAPADTVVALNLPKPDVPAADAIDQVAQRVSWLRDYRGGDCFYASATSATDKAINIEGFGTDVDPFMGLLEAFQAKFKMEPDVSVRLIEPAQCEVTKFLNALGANVAEKPSLQLDRTSVPSGFPISGTLETMGGLRSSLLLIDHKGMVFNLDDRIAVQSGKGIFSIPIGLGASDQAAKKIVPQLLIAVTAPTDIDAAVLAKPALATVVLPQILDEIKAKGLAASATAKYFQLGG